MVRLYTCVQIILFLCQFLQLTKADYRLESVQVVFRHGDRTPTKEEIYPKLPHNPVYDSLGYGQLTEVGKIREYRLGTILRQRYGKFLGDVRNYNDVYAVTTDYDRTKMSLQLVLSGLYPSDQTHLNAIPIIYVPKIVDTTMLPVSCPIYLKELKRIKNSAIVHTLLSKYTDLFEYLSKNTGLDMSSDPLLATSTLYHFLTSQKSMKIPVPEWASDDVQKRMEKIVMLDYEIQSYTTSMKRMYGGHLIKEFIQNMNFKGNANANTPKMFLYSGHELNVAAFAKAHGFILPAIPAYGSAIIVEKWQNSAGQQFVQMLHWTGVTETLLPYIIHKCGNMCPYDKYVQLVQDVIPTNEESNCLWNTITKDSLRLYYSRKF
ncbi:venom acid phosphatase Acph-1 [Xylocopa sonorina]|uniref:venom acid phosphatase Acph-1 n=1 Tax=Xylocopa sonorina TaxID=1818115 RepID=UPI00403AD0A3